jgi:hypothetical protein
MSKTNNGCEFAERGFIKALDNVKKLTVKEIVDKLRSTHIICKNIKDLSSICFAYYDLYFTELISLNFPFRPETIKEFYKHKSLIRDNNMYAKLVGIFNDKDFIKTISEEPPKKKINLHISNQNQYENEWCDWIIKNQEYVFHFNPSNFEKLIEQI